MRANGIVNGVPVTDAEAAAAGVGSDTSDKSAPDYGTDDVTED